MRASKWVIWLVAAIVGGVLLVSAGVFVYIHYIEDDAPKELTFENIDKDATTTTGAGTDTTAAADSIDGEWEATNASIFGYRVKEVLFGQSNEAYGRTQDVAGTMTISGTTATAGKLTVYMTTVKSDQNLRDNQFQGRIMDTADFPTATFTLTEPADFGAVPADKVEVDVELTGDLMLHGVTKSVTVTTQARRNGANIEVTGKIPIVFADYDIDNPSGGPAETEDNGILEFFAVFAPT